MHETFLLSSSYVKQSVALHKEADLVQHGMAVSNDVAKQANVALASQAEREENRGIKMQVTQVQCSALSGGALEKGVVCATPKGTQLPIPEAFIV